jgi:hypothetical protein
MVALSMSGLALIALQPWYAVRPPPIHSTRYLSPLSSAGTDPLLRAQVQLGEPALREAVLALDISGIPRPPPRVPISSLPAGSGSGSVILDRSGSKRARTCRYPSTWTFAS